MLISLKLIIMINISNNFIIEEGIKRKGLWIPLISTEVERKRKEHLISRKYFLIFLKDTL